MIRVVEGIGGPKTGQGDEHLTGTAGGDGRDQTARIVIERVNSVVVQGQRDAGGNALAHLVHRVGIRAVVDRRVYREARDVVGNARAAVRAALDVKRPKSPV